jgi:MFS transporter, DHA1 family, tetracycline resistance protein
MQRAKIIVVFTVLVDVIGFGIVVPILPFYVSSFGASPLTITLLFSTFAFFAFLSAPFLGALSDRIGRRPVLLLSIASTAIGWFVFASAGSLFFLFLGRIIDGSAAGNLTVAQSCLVDVARDEKERASNLGIIGAAFGIGYLVGPAIGGFLSKVSHAFPFWVAGGLSSANVILTYFLLPETNTKRNPESALTFNPLSPLGRAALNVQMHPLFIRWILFALAFMSTQAVFALYVQHAFGFDSFTTGLFFTVSGAFMAFNQAFLLKRVWLKYFDERRLEIMMWVVFFVGFALMGSHYLPLFVVGVPLAGVTQGLLRVAMTSQAAGQADPRMKGEVMGIMSSLMSASLVVAPILGGLLFEWDEVFPYGFAALLACVSFWVARSASRRGQASAQQPTDASP